MRRTTERSDGRRPATKALTWLTGAARGLAVHGGALLPLLLLGLDAWLRRLGPNPIQELTRRTGFPALVLLLLCLACTPAATVSGWRWLQAYRRPLGLYAVLYAAVHLWVFAVLDYGLDGGLLWQTIQEKRFVLAGLGAFALLVPLAVTSTRGWQRRLGRGWKRLHRLVYLAVPLAAVHYVWLVKADIRLPATLLVVSLLLLAMRWPPLRRRLQRGTR